MTEQLSLSYIYMKDNIPTEFLHMYQYIYICVCVCVCVCVSVPHIYQNSVRRNICIFHIYIYVGLHPTDPQNLHLLNFMTEKRAQSQQQRHQWSNGWGSLHV